MEARRTGRAMGTSFTIVVHQRDADRLDGAVRRLERLEELWSRFLPNSEVSVLNRAAAAPVIVSRETFDLVRAAVDGAVATDGRFDPTVHDSLVGLGYDRTLGSIVSGQPARHQPAPGVEGIELDEALSAIRLPRDVRIDLGGIGKGTAADLICMELRDAGARGAAVSIGGDIRVSGESPAESGWNVSRNDALLEIPTLDDGGACTSTTRLRRWSTADGEVHHIVNPRTGAPTVGIESVTVVGATAQQCEVLTKAAMVAGVGAPALLERFGVISQITWARTDSLISA